MAQPAGEHRNDAEALRTGCLNALDYYGSMILPPRRIRLAAAVLPVFFALAACSQMAPRPPEHPASPPPVAEPAGAVRPPAPEAAVAPAEKTPAQSALTAQLFYEILVGELSARGGNTGDGYSLILDAARKTGDPRLFQRAIEIALQSRAGDAALAAARAWKQAQPASRDARRFELQILIALNRIGETIEPLRAELAATPEVEHPLLMAVIARSYGRATDKKLAASVVEQALVDDLKNPATAGMAWATVGRLRLMAGDTSGAIEAANKGEEADPRSEGPPALALEMIDPAQPLAEPIVKRYLAGPRAAPEIRMAYARVLTQAQRYNDASAELMLLTAARPDLPEPWLLLGLLQSQTRQDNAAEASLKRYLELAHGQHDAGERKRGQTQAFLMLSRLAERRKDFPAAEMWLSKVDDADGLVAAQTRRASLLAREGKLPQARELIRGLPDGTPQEKKQKFLANLQVLREAGQYQAAYDMLARASADEPDNGDLIYDQAMMAEKLNHLDDMERLLRRLMSIEPDNQNAYNALGYSLADRNIRLDEARTLIRKAVQLAPDDPFIADSLGWVEFRLGNTAEATRILEAAYKKQPDPEIGAHLGEVLWTAGDKDRARQIWREAARAQTDNETLQETLKRLHVSL